jgi:hypothetical protein
MSAKVYQLDDVWDVSVDVKNADGTAASGTATITVTLPDGTHVGPTTVSASPPGHFPYTRTIAAVGRHRAVWRFTGASQDSKEFTIDVRGPLAAHEPTAQDIANVIPRLTLGSNGLERGTFDATTIPTDDVAEQIGSTWANRVLLAVGGLLPVPTTGDLNRHVDAARYAAAIGAARQIVNSYYPEKTELVQQLDSDYTHAVDALKLGHAPLVA